jgi:hypothetical protein
MMANSRRQMRGSSPYSNVRNRRLGAGNMGNVPYEEYCLLGCDVVYKFTDFYMNVLLTSSS